MSSPIQNRIQKCLKNRAQNCIKIIKLQKISGKRLVKRIYRAEVEGTRGRGRLLTRWRDRVKKVLGRKGMTIQWAEIGVQDRKRESIWKISVPPLTNKFEEPYQIIFSWYLQVLGGGSIAETGLEDC